MAEAPEVPSSVTYHYLKSNGFRVVHADGMFGGATPHGMVQIAFFNERFPIPQSAEYAVTATGKPGMATVGQELARSGKEGLIREVEVSVVMTVEIAQALRVWLDTHIKPPPTDGTT